jgi:hypothetical protein
MHHGVLTSLSLPLFWSSSISTATPADNKYIAIYGSVAFLGGCLAKPASNDPLKFRTTTGCNKTHFRNLYNSASRFVYHGRSSRGICCGAILRSFQEPTALRRGHRSPWPGRLGCNKGRARQDAGQNQSPISRIMIRVAVDSDIFFFSISSDHRFDLPDDSGLEIIPPDQLKHLLDSR